MAITVKCIRGDGDKEAPSISDSMIVTEAIATARGKRYLDDPEGIYYTVKKRTLRVPHAGEAVKPGAWVTVTDSHLGLVARKLRVSTYNLTITPKAVWAEMEAHQYVEPTS